MLFKNSEIKDRMHYQRLDYQPLYKAIVGSARICIGMADYRAVP